MTDAAIDRPTSAKAKRGGTLKPRTIVSGSQLAQHLDCARQYIAKLQREGIIEQTRGGFDVDVCRMRYIQFLRRERKASTVNAAQQAFTEAKTALLRQRHAERQRDLIPSAEAIAVVDDVVGLVLTRLGMLPAIIGGADLALRRKVERAVFDARKAIAEEAQRQADACKPREDTDA